MGVRVRRSRSAASPDKRPPAPPATGGLLDSLLEVTPVGIAILDRRFRYVYINSVLAAINGRDRHDHPGRSVREVVPEIAEGIIKDFRRVIATRKAVSNIEIHGPTPARPNVPRYWSCTYTPILSDRGRVEYLAVLVQDVTDRRLAEQQRSRAFEELRSAQEQLIRSEKLASIGMLVSGVAHELNNPLNVMHGNLKLMLEEAASPGGDGKRNPRRMLKDAVRASEHARKILQDFLSFARDTRTASRVNLHGCIEDAWSLLSHDTKQRLTVVKRFRGSPAVQGVASQLTQVFLNLLTNASEAMRGRGTITVTSGRSNGDVRVDVADDGPGMREAVRAKVFEPFFTTKEDGKGLGLGLSISALIVHNHGGELTVTSRPGKGARFRVTLPLKRRT